MDPDCELLEKRSLSQSNRTQLTCILTEGTCRYWQGFVGKAPMYGSDNHSTTLFDGGAGAWNLGALDTILRRRIRKVMPGASRRRRRRRVLGAEHLVMSGAACCACIGGISLPMLPTGAVSPTRSLDRG